METQKTPRFLGSENAEDLKQFTGTEQYHSCMAFVYTDGVNYLIQTRKCYWLLCDIALCIMSRIELKEEQFLICELTRHDKGATLVFLDGKSEIWYTQEYSHKEFNKFDDKGVRLYFVDGVLMLPSEMNFFLR